MFLHRVVSHNLQYKVKEKYLKFRNLRVGRETVGRKTIFFFPFFSFYFQLCICLISPKTIRIWCSEVFLQGPPQSLPKLAESNSLSFHIAVCRAGEVSHGETIAPLLCAPTFPVLCQSMQAAGRKLALLFSWGKTKMATVSPSVL